MGIRATFTRTGDVLIAKLHGELAATLSIDGCAHLPSGDVAVDFVSAPTAQDLIDAQAVIDAHDPTDYDAQDKAAASARFENAKQDFINLLATLAPLYDGLTPAQRQTQIDNFATFNTLTAAQKDNALGFATALFVIALDYLRRD